MHDLAAIGCLDRHTMLFRLPVTNLFGDDHGNDNQQINYEPQPKCVSDLHGLVLTNQARAYQKSEEANADHRQQNANKYEQTIFTTKSHAAMLFLPQG